MLLSLPFLAFSMIFVLLYESLRAEFFNSKWQAVLLISSILCGTLVTISTEVLGTFSLINQASTAIFWAVISLLLLLVGLRYGHYKSFWFRFRRTMTSLRWGKFEIALALGISGILLLLFIIAVVSPPNNVDSFIYHMSRVVHWAQNQSLRHYPTYRDHQLIKPIWAESAILHMRILWGSDRLANLVQWFSMLGSVIGVTGIASLFGANRKGKWLAAIFAVTIPMGILQSTSTQNDYATAFWVVCMAYFVVLSMKRELSKFEFVCLALSFGLGVLTKGTFFVYFPPLLALFFLARLRKRGFLKSAAYGLILILVVAVLNTPFWSRNVQTYGGPYGTSEWLQRNLSFDVEFLERFFPDIESTSNEEGMDRNVILDVGEDGLRAKLARAQPEDIPIAREPSTGKDDSPNAVFVYLSRLAMTAGRNFTSPFGFVTDQLIRFVRAFPAVFGVAYPDELKASAWNHEDHAGNLHQLILVPISIILLIFQRSIRRNSLLVSYTITVLCTYALLPIVIGHGPGFWGVRYQLPFFLLWAPIFGVVISALDRNWLTIGAAGLLLTASLPWVLLNNTRPIIGLPPWPTKIESIFTADQDEILLATNPGLRDDFTLTANTIREADCKNVGLVIEADFLEYPLWWLLDAPQSGVRIETLNSYARLSQEINQDFTPCAVVCTICGDMEEFHGLIKAGEFDSITLFLEPELVTK